MGNTWPSLASSGFRLVIFAIPGLWMAQQPWFEMRHLFTLSIATTGLQALASFLLLRWQFRERLGKAPAHAAINPGQA
jgi:Na+-driven multidrug efflux pump